MMLPGPLAAWPFLQRLSGLHQTEPDQWMACCPIHDDGAKRDKPSLAVSIGREGQLLLLCHACGKDATPRIVAALGATMGDLLPPHARNGHANNGHANNGRARNGKSKGRNLGPITETYLYCDPAGREVYQVCRHNPKDFSQRRRDERGRWVWGLTAGHYFQGRDGEWRKAKRPGDSTRYFPECERLLYRLPELLAAPSDQTIFVVEGEKDVHSLLKRSNGALLATTAPGGVGKWQRSFSETLRGRDVVLIPDIDKPERGQDHPAGMRHALEVAAALHGIAGRVRILTLSDLDGNLTPKFDLTDWILAGGTKLQFDELLNSAPVWSPDTSINLSTVAAVDPRPEIQITTDEHLVNDAAVAALASDRSIFQRGTKLVRVIRDGGEVRGINRPANSPQIVDLPLATVRERLAAAARFVVIRKDGEESPKHPPVWTVNAVAARGSWPGIRRLRGITETPILLSDGSILSTPGYDHLSELLYEPNGELPCVPDCPTPNDVAAARDLLTDLICDFPFDKPAHRSTWIAFLLTALARYAFDGPSPLFLIDANVRGSGKTLLAELVALIVTGRPMARMANPHDDDEARKRITAIAVCGDSLVLIDNISGTLGGASLDAALTGTVWKDRILGRSEIVELPLNVTWAASGNNVVLSGDTSRRVAHIRLSSREEFPEERENFKHRDIKAHCRENRMRYIAAGLTILRGYVVAGRPAMPGIKPWGSFEGWSDLIRQAVVWCGLDDPGATREELRSQSDREAEILRSLIVGWEELDPHGHGYSAAEALNEIIRCPTDYTVLSEAICELCNTPAGKLPSSRVLGNRIRHLRGRVIGGRAMDARMRGHLSLWYVAKIGTSAVESDESVESVGQYPYARISDVQNCEIRQRGPEDSTDSQDSTGRQNGHSPNPSEIEHRHGRSCGSRRWWRDTFGMYICLDCNPPESKESVESYGELQLNGQ